jgi:beta-lactamase class C
MSGAAALTACASGNLLNSAAPLPQERGFAPQPDGDLESAIRHLIEQYIATSRRNGQEHVGVVAGIVSDKLPKTSLLFGGQLVAAKDHSRTIPLGADTPFEIGSITKVFCSWVFGTRRRTYGGVLGDYIHVALPSGILDMSIDSIVSYSSGFPTDDVPPIWTGNGFVDQRSLDGLTKSLSGKSLPQCASGKFYSYSNFAWGLLGLAAVGVSSVKTPVDLLWAEAIRDLCAYVGLSVRTAPANKDTAEELPAGYRGDGSLLPESFDYLKPSFKTMYGAFDLVSTGDDMYRWLRYNMGYGPRDRLLRVQQSPTWTWTRKEPSQESGTLTCRPTVPLTTSTAIGWFRPAKSAVPFLSKNGGVAGFTSWMGFADWISTGKPSPAGAFVLTNHTKNAATTLGRSIFEVLTG